MVKKRYVVLDNDNSYSIRVVNEEGLSSEKAYSENNTFSLEEIFQYMIENTNLTYLDIWGLFDENKIEFSKIDLIEYYISNSSLFGEGDDDLSIKIKINKGCIYEILSILPKSKMSGKNIKGASLTLNINKAYLPFYLAIFVKEYSIENYYSTTKKVLGDSRYISFVDLYNHYKEYYVVKNRDKVVYIATSKEVANKYVEIIRNIRKDDSQYFVPSIEILVGFKNLINYLKMYNSYLIPNNIKNIVDFIDTESFLMSQERKVCEVNSNIFKSKDRYVVRTKDDDYIFKSGLSEVYSFIVDNKICDPEIILMSDMERLVSKKELFKSIFLINEMDVSLLDSLNGLSIFCDDNLMKIYSNLVNLALDESMSNPKILFVKKVKENSFDALFFVDKLSVDIFKNNNNKHFDILSMIDFSLDYVKSKLMEKNLEIVMNDRSSFDTMDVAINLTHIYKKNLNAPKIKNIKDIECVIDVDASLNGDIASCGVVLRDSSDKILGKISRELPAQTSVEAEIRGAMYAIKYAIMENMSEICIRYDYLGIFEYLISDSSINIANEYRDFFRNVVNNNDINIYFKKVKAHSSDLYNELADYLAGNLR